MNRDASESPNSLQIARRLLAQDAASGKERDPTKVGAALQQTCARVFESLRDAMGEAGGNALLARALTRTEAQHPALKSIRRLNEGRIHLDGVAVGVEAHGVTAVTSAIEALLAALIEILGRLIGDEMAIRLIDQDALRPPTGGGAKAP